MYLIPQVKSSTKCTPFVLDGCFFEFDKNIDERVVALASKVPHGKAKAKVSLDLALDENTYKLSLSSESVSITAGSQASLFYALQTLRQIVKQKNCDIKEIIDSPDFKDRGFYLDITRGRIPTLDSLKMLVDELAYYKKNMLQLYVEHTFPFKEYDGIYQRTGFISPEEIKELDAYCKENFIEFVPSLSCFGHLYELLSDERYKHLCELSNYKDKTVFWCERMGHHTINPLLDESFELIKSLIDQYSPLFTSDKFNICCDETFDLGQDVNKDKDKGKLYVSFVRKILDYVKSKGRIPMMWGDVIARHSDLISELGDGILFLSWGYSANEKPDMVNTVKNASKKQYVCPGLNNWTSLIEKPEVSVPNITKMIQYGYDAEAEGVLTTCWGDYGHLSSIYACMYGTIFSAAKSWNVKCEYTDFDDALDVLYYGYAGATKQMLRVANAQKGCFWYELVCDYSNELFGADIMKAWNRSTPEQLLCAYNELEEAILSLMSVSWENDKAREIILCVAQGMQLMVSMLMSRESGERLGMIFEDVEAWLKDFARLYLEESKEGELEEFIKVFYHLGKKYLK